MAAMGDKSLEFGVVGLGECGCNLAVEFDRLGYSTVGLNTSYTDLRGLPLSEKLYIGLNGRDGAGQDVRLGAQCLEASTDDILEKVGTALEACDHVVIAAGLGGGTGSNGIALANMISSLGKPISILGTLPKDQEGSIAKVNAVQAMNQLHDTDVTSVILADNEKILRQFRSDSLTEFYHNANRAVVQTLHDLNTVAHDSSITPIRGFDGEDFRRVFTSRGALIYGQIDLNPKDLTTEDQLAKGLQNVWDNAGLLASGFDYQEATMAGVILIAPESLLAKAPAEAFENLIKQIRELTSTVGIYTGLFATSDENAPPRLYTMLSGLPYPNRLKNVVSQAKEEGPQLGLKVARPIEVLDIDDLSTIDLFNTTTLPPSIPVKQRSPQETAEATNKPEQKKSSADSTDSSDEAQAE